MDAMTPAQRRKAMQHNRGRTRPERKLASALWRAGFRYLTSEGFRSRYGARLVGNPDIIFPAKRLVVFLDGCFWHGCDRCGKVNRDMNAFWLRKIRTNRERDRRVNRILRKAGWRVLRVPEHDVRDGARLARTVRLIVEALMTR